MSQCISDKLCYGHGRCELLSRVVEGIRCIRLQFNSQVRMTVASKYLLAAGKQVYANSACCNANCKRISDMLRCGRAWSELLPQVVKGIRCIQPKFDSQMHVTVASMYKSAAD